MQAGNARSRVSRAAQLRPKSKAEPGAAPKSHRRQGTPFHASVGLHVGESEPQIDPQRAQVSSYPQLTNTLTKSFKIPLAILSESRILPIHGTVPPHCPSPRHLPATPPYRGNGDAPERSARAGRIPPRTPKRHPARSRNAPRRFAHNQTGSGGPCAYPNPRIGNGRPASNFQPARARPALQVAPPHRRPRKFDHYFQAQSNPNGSFQTDLGSSLFSHWNAPRPLFTSWVRPALFTLELDQPLFTYWVRPAALFILDFNSLALFTLPTTLYLLALTRRSFHTGPLYLLVLHCGPADLPSFELPRLTPSTPASRTWPASARPCSRP